MGRRKKILVAKCLVAFMALIAVTAYLNVWKPVDATILYGPGLRQASCPDTMEIIYEPVFHQTEARDMLDYVNKFRTRDPWCWNEDNTEKITYSNLDELVYDYELEKVAMLRAAEIAIGYGHTRLDGTDFWTAYYDSEYDYGICSENIAGGQDSAYWAYVAWREDNYKYSGQGHRRNMVNATYKAIGIAYVTIGQETYFVQEFSDRVSDATETEAVDTAAPINVKISASLMTLASSEKDSVSVGVGQRISIPDVRATVEVPVSVFYGNIDICVPKVFDTADNEYVSIEKNKIIGLKPGIGHVTGVLLGEEVSLEVTVYETDEPEEPEEPEEKLEPYIPESSAPMWERKTTIPEWTCAICGDVDGDEEVTAKDVTMLRRHLAGGWEVSLSEEEGDLDGDGAVTAKDVTMLRRYLAGGWDVSLPEKPDQDRERYVTINEKNFPDDYFRRYVSGHFDTNNDGKLDEKEVSEIKVVDCSPSEYLLDDELSLYSSHYELYRDYYPEYLNGAIESAELRFWSDGKGIKSLKGIEYFSNLETLCCRYNQLSEMDLSANTELQYLDFRDNKFSTVEVTNKKLTIDNVLFDEGVQGIFGFVGYYYDDEGNVVRSSYFVSYFDGQSFGMDLYSENKTYYSGGGRLAQYGEFFKFDGYGKGINIHYDEDGEITKEYFIYSFDDGSRIEEYYRFSNGEKELYQITTRDIKGRWKYKTLDQ